MFTQQVRFKLVLEMRENVIKLEERAVFYDFEDPSASSDRLLQASVAQVCHHAHHTNFNPRVFHNCQTSPLQAADHLVKPFSSTPTIPFLDAPSTS